MMRLAQMNNPKLRKSVGANEAGARAAAAVLTDLLGVRAYAASRID
jgi:hypothetical protein